jgi:hypothetical protein
MACDGLRPVQPHSKQCKIYVNLLPHDLDQLIRQHKEISDLLVAQTHYFWSQAVPPPNLMASSRMACARHFGYDEQHSFPDRSCFETTTLLTTMCIATILINNISYIHEVYSRLKLNQSQPNVVKHQT